MRYALLTGAMVAGAVASPLAARAVVTEWDYVTQVVTVTADDGANNAKATPSTEATAHWWDQFKYPAAATPSSSPKSVAAKQYAKPSPKPEPTRETTTASVASIADAQPTNSKGGKPSFEEIVVMHHNIHRTNHSARKVSWDQDLADTAMKIGKSCNYAHDVSMDGGGYGQNIAAGAPADNISSIITDHFYNDEMGFFEPFYGQDTPSDMSDATFDKFGHFTQIVWKSTTKVGCAVVDCSGGGNGPNGLGSVADNVPPYFTVCNYSPPGNYLGSFDKNVARPLGNPTVDWSYGL